MSERTDLSYMASLYMALADQTRLRLLSQMYAGEVCVADCTDALGDSQPKISRHLAYLRNAGVVKTRRDGKWIHYSIRWPEEAGGQAVLRAALDWMTGDNWMDLADRRVDRPTWPTEDRPIQPLDIYTDMRLEEKEYEPSGSAHNELEEFLL